MERWLALACTDQLKCISGMLTYQKDYTFVRGGYFPVLSRSIMYHIHRYHLHLANAQKESFSQRFCPLLIHAHFRADADMLIEFASQFYAWDNHALPDIKLIANSKFYAHLNRDMPDNLYHIKRSLALRKMDMCVELGYLESYRKAFENHDYLHRPEFLNAARKSMMIIGESWRRTMDQFDSNDIDPGLLMLFEQCRFTIRNPEEHVIDPTAYKDSARTNFAFGVDVTSDFAIQKIWREMTSLIHDNPKLIDEFFCMAKAITLAESQENITRLTTYFHSVFITQQLHALFHQSIDYESATQPSYLKYLQGKIKLLRLQFHNAPHDLKLLSFIERNLATMTREDIQGICKLLGSQTAELKM